MNSWHRHHRLRAVVAQFDWIHWMPSTSWIRRRMNERVNTTKCQTSVSVSGFSRIFFYFYILLRRRVRSLLWSIFGTTYLLNKLWIYALFDSSFLFFSGLRWIWFDLLFRIIRANVSPKHQTTLNGTKTQKFYEEMSAYFLRWHK